MVFVCYPAPVKAALAEPEIVIRNGKPVSVILPIKAYREIMERLEDADDVAWLKKARLKPLHYRPLEDLAKKKSKEVVEKGAEVCAKA